MLMSDNVCLFVAYLLVSVLTAGSVSHAERRNGENRHTAHQRQRKPNQGSGTAQENLPNTMIDCLVTCSKGIINYLPSKYDLASMSRDRT